MGGKTYLGSGQGKGARLQDLLAVALGGVLHRHDHAVAAAHQVHGTAHACCMGKVGGWVGRRFE